MPKCKICKREYKRKKCEFCFRLEQWEKREKCKILTKFTPRIVKNIQKYNFDKNFVEIGLSILKKGKGVFAQGVVGSKKTSYSAYISLEWLKNKYVEGSIGSFEFINSDTFTRMLKDTFNDKTKSENKIIEKYAKVDFLFFDDIGVDKSNEWLYNALYSLINYRYDYLKHETILTSNLTTEELSKKWKDKRVTSRIKGDYGVWNFGKTDFR